MKLTNTTRYGPNAFVLMPHTTCPVCKGVLWPNDPTHVHDKKAEQLQEEKFTEERP